MNFYMKANYVCKIFERLQGIVLISSMEEGPRSHMLSKSKLENE